MMFAVQISVERNCNQMLHNIKSDSSELCESTATVQVKQDMEQARSFMLQICWIKFGFNFICRFLHKSGE